MELTGRIIAALNRINNGVMRLFPFLARPNSTCFFSKHRIVLILKLASEKFETLKPTDGIPETLRFQFRKLLSDNPSGRKIAKLNSSRGTQAPYCNNVGIKHPIYGIPQHFLIHTENETRTF